jgi:hypothetical protein
VRAADGEVATLWRNPGRVVGYSMFLRLLHEVAPHLVLVIIVQHALGLLAGAPLPRRPPLRGTARAGGGTRRDHRPGRR